MASDGKTAEPGSIRSWPLLEFPVKSIKQELYVARPMCLSICVTLWINQSSIAGRYQVFGRHVFGLLVNNSYASRTGSQ